MATDRTVKLPPELWSQVEGIATASHRSVDEVLEEAARKFVILKRFREFVAKNQKRMDALGLTEDDVPRIVKEWRAEQRRS